MDVSGQIPPLQPFPISEMGIFSLLPFSPLPRLFPFFTTVGPQPVGRDFSHSLYSFASLPFKLQERYSSPITLLLLSRIGFSFTMHETICHPFPMITRLFVLRSEVCPIDRADCVAGNSSAELAFALLPLT